MVHFLLPAIVSACGAQAPTPARVEIPASAVVDSLGRLSDATGTEVLSHVVGARLSESGRYLAVLDHAPPFIRILDRVERSVQSFGPRGSGPGELERPDALDFLGDSVLLVVSGQRLERFSVRGEWLGGELAPERGLRPVSITTGCGGRVFVYGVPENYPRLDDVPWLHELDLDTDAPAEARLIVPGRAGVVRFGALIGLDGTESGIWLWHEQVQSGVEAGYWVPCDDAPPRVLDAVNVGESVAQAFRDGSRSVMSLTLPDTLFAGAAAQHTTAVRAFRWNRSREEDEVTSLRVIEEERCAVLELVGRWTIHDLHRDRLVLGRSEPFPAALVVDWGWVERTRLTQPCRPT